MPTFRMTLAYDGGRYCGWQSQPNGRSIQQQIETALFQVTRCQVRVIGSGRTDAGVHALGQVAGFQVQTRLPADVLARALNAFLPDDIRVLQLDRVSDRFHAIRDAKRKRYRYDIQTGPVQNVFVRKRCWYVRWPLSVEAMQSAADHLVGKHDFACFQAAGSPRKSTVRTIFDFPVQLVESGYRMQEAERFIRIEVEADGFLYNMVRNLVGQLVDVGRGVETPERIGALLGSRDRRLAGPTAPAQGLFLVSVQYPTSGDTHQSSQ